MVVKWICCVLLTAVLTTDTVEANNKYRGRYKFKANGQKVSYPEKLSLTQSRTTHRVFVDGEEVFPRDRYQSTEQGGQFRWTKDGKEICFLLEQPTSRRKAHKVFLNGEEVYPGERSPYEAYGGKLRWSRYGLELCYPMDYLSDEPEGVIRWYKGGKEICYPSEYSPSERGGKIRWSKDGKLICYPIEYRSNDYKSDYDESEYDELPDENHIDKSCESCGQAVEGNSMIINGQKVSPRNKYPWMVSLSRTGVVDKHCGAAIISNEFILTAAHCLKRNGNIVRVNEDTCVYDDGERMPCFYTDEEVAVSFLSNSSKMTLGPSIAEIIPHPEYMPNMVSVKNDIAIIRLSQAIPCTSYSNPICLPGPRLPLKTGIMMRVSGWGSSMSRGPTVGEEELRETRIAIEDDEKCQAVSGFHSPLSICLSGRGGGSPCFGDSGGPMFYEIAGRYFAMGLASAHTSRECDTNANVVYTSVQAYMDWIKEVTGLKEMSVAKLLKDKNKIT